MEEEEERLRELAYLAAVHDIQEEQMWYEEQFNMRTGKIKIEYDKNRVNIAEISGVSSNRA